MCYLRDVDGDDVRLAALVEEPDGQLAGGAALLLHPHREVPVRVLARHPAHGAALTKFEGTLRFPIHSRDKKEKKRKENPLLHPCWFMAAATQHEKNGYLLLLQ